MVVTSVVGILDMAVVTSGMVMDTSDMVIMEMATMEDILTIQL